MPYGGWNIHIGEVEGNRVVQATDAGEYDEKLKRHRPICLARFIAGQRTVHPAAVLVMADTFRLGRIPPELWCGYDAVHLADLPAITLLSAKARAVFPDWPQAVIRVVRQSDVPGLNLVAVRTRAVRSFGRCRDMGRYDADGGQVPTTLFEAAAFHRTIKARCSCEREAVFHAAALWWLFQQKRWPAHLDFVPERLRCTGCGRRGVPIVAGRDAPTVTSLPMPDDGEWKRAVSRFRS